MSAFRAYVWDPTLLVSQMVFIQTMFYSIETASLIGYGTFSSYDPNLSTIFSIQVNRAMVVSQLLSSIGCAAGLSIVVQRAKQCLDFSCTLHFFHFLLCILYSHSFPTQLLWWLLQLASTVICTVLGEYLCMRMESREIKLGAPSKYDL